MTAEPEKEFVFPADAVGEARLEPVPGPPEPVVAEEEAAPLPDARVLAAEMGLDADELLGWARQNPDAFEAARSSGLISEASTPAELARNLTTMATLAEQHENASWSRSELLDLARAAREEGHDPAQIADILFAHDQEAAGVFVNEWVADELPQPSAVDWIRARGEQLERAEQEAALAEREQTTNEILGSMLGEIAKVNGDSKTLEPYLAAILSSEAWEGPASIEDAPTAARQLLADGEALRRADLETTFFDSWDATVAGSVSNLRDEVPLVAKPNPETREWRLAEALERMGRPAPVETSAERFAKVVAERESWRAENEAWEKAAHAHRQRVAAEKLNPTRRGHSTLERDAAAAWNREAFGSAA